MRTWEPFVAWSSIVLGTLLFVFETGHGIAYGSSPPGLVIDYIAAALLWYAGLQSLRHPASGASGLLFGAWAYALCDHFRAVWWRAERYLEGTASEPLMEPFAVFVALTAASVVTLFFFGVSFHLAHPRAGRP